MNYRDTLVTCRECGTQFVFTVEDQRRTAERGLDVTPPERCGPCTQRVTYGGKLHGRIKWYSPEKGYGFIVADDGREIFAHRNSLLPTADGQPPPLDEGQEVLFEVTDSPKGPQAVQVAPYG